MAAAVQSLDTSRFGYLKKADIARLSDAYRFSESAHAGQKRQSGDPYISHPLAVAEILAGWRLDSQALAAALLHDVMEDTSVTKAEIAETFGKPVADLVDGLSKLDKIEFQSAEDAQAVVVAHELLDRAVDQIAGDRDQVGRRPRGRRDRPLQTAGADRRGGHGGRLYGGAAAAGAAAGGAHRAWNAGIPAPGPADGADVGQFDEQGDGKDGSWVRPHPPCGPHHGEHDAQ